MGLAVDLLDLLDNDAYLLWEVKELAASRSDFSMSYLIETVSSLIENGTIVCLRQPIIGSQNADALNIREAIGVVTEERNWQPPLSDHTDTFWLARPAKFYAAIIAARKSAVNADESS